jgi:hypothetical protein
MSLVSRFFSIALAALPFFLLSCDNDDSDAVQPTVQLLELSVDANYYSENVDNWVMVHDKNGELLGVKQFGNGQVVTLETLNAVPDDLISITLLSYNKASTSTRKSISMETYSHLTKGQKWTLTVPTPIDGPNLDEPNKFSVLISDVPNLYSFAMTNLEGRGIHSWGYTGATATIDGSGTFYEKSKSTFMVSTESERGRPKYTFVDNVTNGGHYELSASDFSDFDHIMEVNFPTPDDLFCRMTTYDPETNTDGYTLSLVSSAHEPWNKFSLGYLNAFKKYNVYIDLDYDNTNYYYRAKGDLKPINFPFNVDYSLQNTDVNNFTLAGNPAYAYRSSTYYQWETGDPNLYVYWTVLSPTADFKLLSFPKEITDTYPFLNVASFDHSTTTFSLGEKSSYDNAIDTRYKGKAVSHEYELYQVRVKE